MFWMCAAKEFAMPRLQMPTETTMKLTDAKQQLSQVINRVARGETRVVVEKSGLPVAAIIAAEEYRRFVAAEEEREARFEAISRISEAFADVPVDELERQATRALREARNRARAAGGTPTS
jgi:prevent-host-death family protein